MTELFPRAIETDRLRLERLDRSVDALEYYEVCAHDPGIEAVADPMPWDPHDHPAESAAALERAAEKFEDGEAASYAIRPAEGENGAGAFAGRGTLRVKRDKRVGVLSVWLRKRFWGRGYSGERAAALVALAFDRLDLDVVVVSHEVGNDESRRAVEKYVERFGGRREGVLRNYLPWGEEPGDAVRYTIAAAEFAENRPDDLRVSFED